MASVAHELNNLIGGVSQQPDASRIANTCTVMDNAWPSPVYGLTKRSPSQFVGQPVATPATLTAYHVIHRDAAEQYVVTAGNGGIQVYNAVTGATCTVTDPGTIGVGYLGITDPDQLEFLTVDDTTFVLNKTRTVTMQATTSPALAEEGMVFMRQANYLTTYKIRVEYTDSSAVPRFWTHTITTWNGSSLTPTFTFSIDTRVIMAAFTADAQADAIFGADFDITQVGSTMHFVSNSAATLTSVTVEDGTGDSSLEVVYKEVPRVAGFLPDQAAHGFLVKVVGDAEVDGDDYWVRFESEDLTGFGTGRWLETLAPGTEYDLTATTLPHRLVNTAANTFEWRTVNWARRTVGDSTTNADPSFVDATISGMFFYKNRLGFLSGENVIMSEAGEYSNFFRVTLLVLRDSARIDVAASHTRVSIFETAQTFGTDLVLSTDRSQFILRGDEILSPRTVQILPASEYEVSTGIKPVSTGRSLFFPFNRKAYDGVREMFPVQDGLRFESLDITDSVPRYIPGITHMTASTIEGALFALGDDGYIYAYTYLWGSQGKLQSSWGRWTFGDAPVLHCECVNDDLIVVLDRDGQLTIERITIPVNETTGDLGFTCHLDSLVTQDDVTSLTYNAGPDTTTFDLPYDEDTSIILCVRADDGEAITVVSVVGTTVTLDGDYSATDFYIGRRYTMTYTFSTPLVRYREGNGTAARHNDPQHIARGHLQYADSSFFNVKVTVGSRSARNMTYLSYETGNPPALRDGEFTFGVMGAAKDCVITVTNISPYPSNLTAVTWDTIYRKRPGRFTG